MMNSSKIVTDSGTNESTDAYCVRAHLPNYLLSKKTVAPAITVI